MVDNAGASAGFACTQERMGAGAPDSSSIVAQTASFN